MKWIKLTGPAFDARSETWSLLRDDGSPARLMISKNPWPDGWSLLHDQGEDRMPHVLAIFGTLEDAQGAGIGLYRGEGEYRLSKRQIEIAQRIAESGCDLGNGESVVEALVGMGVRPSSVSLPFEAIVHLARHLRDVGELIARAARKEKEEAAS